MSKRQLDNKYKDLVDWVKEMKGQGEATRSLAFILSGIYNLKYEGSIGDILKDLNEDLKLNSSNHLIPIIVDIYNNNYELEEPKYYWKFNELTGGFVHDLYLSIRVGYPDTKLSDKNCGLLDPEQYHIMKFTKSNVNQYLMDNTNLTIDNFNPVEEISHD